MVGITIIFTGPLLLIVCLIVSVVLLGLVTTNSILKGIVPTVAVNVTIPLPYTQTESSAATMEATGVGLTVTVTTLEVALHCAAFTILL